jgi:hypothetical protein
MPTKAKTNQPQTETEIQVRDLFQTPNYAVDLLIPFIPPNITHIWEPAAGYRKIVNRLEERGYKTLATDIRKLPEVELYNFVVDPNREDVYNNRFAIITNPPFSLKHKFYEKCREYGLPFALLIPADYSGWICDAIANDGAEKIVPTRRVDYITPTYKEKSASQFHSMWLTWGFNIGKSETIVDLTKEMKMNI